MAFKKPSVKKVKTTIESAQLYIRSERKWGKSTLFRNMVLAKYGDPERGMLIGCGHEEGYGFLDQLNSTQVETYEELFELVDWLIKEKGHEHNIEMVAFDVVDEIIPMMEARTVKMSIKETGKPCKTINEAFGGFHKGQKRTSEEIKNLMSKLKKAGIGVTAISHTKTKTIKPQGTATEEEGYMTFTSTLEATYESVFGDIFDIVVTGVIEREVDNKLLKSANRYLYFRGDGYVEAGGRLAGESIVDKMLFEGKSDYELAKEFIEIVEDAMRKSTLAPAISKEEFKEKQIEETKERLENAKEFIEEEKVKPVIDEDRNAEIKEIITAKWKTLTKDVKEQAKEIMKKNRIEKLGEIESNSTSGMEEILKLIQ